MFILDFCYCNFSPFLEPFGTSKTYSSKKKTNILCTFVHSNISIIPNSRIEGSINNFQTRYCTSTTNMMGTWYVLEISG